MNEENKEIYTETVSPYGKDEAGVQKGDVVKVVPEPDRRKSGGITGSTLKIIAIVTMFIDHIGASVFEHYINILAVSGSDYCRDLITSKVPGLWSEWMGNIVVVQSIDLLLRAIGRIAFPIFCFLLVEGFLHTRNVKKYLVRLFIFAFISDVPFDLAFFAKIGLNHQNVFFTLFLGVSALACIDYVRHKDKDSFNGFYTFLGKIGVVIAGVLGALAFSTCMFSFIGYLISQKVPVNEYVPSLAIGFIGGIAAYIPVTHKWDEERKIKLSASLFATLFFFTLAEVMHTDYGGWGVLAIVAIYAFRNARNNGFIWGVTALTVMNLFEGVAFLDLIPVRFYNGKRGRQMKYFFYAFYPVHLFLLFLVRYFVLGF
ncbi:MAG: hypothetical protein J6X94_10965 [Lachnospiraceae bacterium]|nr:hypothetical protein [Lachnospiraceae bacterium]